MFWIYGVNPILMFLGSKFVWGILVGYSLHMAEVGRLGSLKSRVTTPHTSSFQPNCESVEPWPLGLGPQVFWGLELQSRRELL